jgi:ankyrin repeat protein
MSAPVPESKATLPKDEKSGELDEIATMINDILKITEAMTVMEDIKQAIQVDVKREDDNIQKQLYLLALRKQNVECKKIDINSDGTRSIILDKKTSNEISYNAEERKKLDEYIKFHKTPLLVDAIVTGYLKAATKLIADGADINNKDTQHGTALYLAAKSDHLDLVKLMLQKPTNIELSNAISIFNAATGDNKDNIKKLITDNIGQKLVSAVQEENKGAATEILTELAAYPIELSSILGSNPNLLNDAVANKLDDVAMILIKNGANIRAKNMNGKMSIDIALENSSEIITAALTKKQKELNADLLKEINAKKRIGLKEVKNLLSQGADPNCSSSTTKSLEAGYTPLHYAAALFNDGLSELLVEAGGDPNKKSASKDTPIHIAAHSNNEHLIAAFGDKLNLAAKDSFGRTPMDVAKAFGSKKAMKALEAVQQKLDSQLLEGVKANNIETIEQLMAAGANPFSLDKEHKTPLHHSQEKNISVLLKGLSEEKRKELCAVKDKYGKTALHYATSPEQVAVLLDNGADIHAKDNLGNAPIRIAAYNAGKGSDELFNELIRRGANIKDISSNLPGLRNTKHIERHIKANNELLKVTNVDLINKALEDGAYIETVDPNSKQTALHIAAANGNLNAVNALIDAGANILARDKDGNTAANIAHKLFEEERKNHSKENRYSVLSPKLDLLTQEAKLLLAAEKGESSKVKKYLKDNPKDAIITEALFSAATKGHIATLNILLEKYPGKINSINLEGESLLYAAVRAEKTNIVNTLTTRQLLSPMAFKDDVPSPIPTALHVAIDRDKPNKNIIKTLIEFSPVSLNITNKSGQTAAHLAVMHRNIHALKAIIATGKADLTLKDAEGKTPIELAEAFGYKDALALFKKAPALVNKHSHNTILTHSAQATALAPSITDLAKLTTELRQRVDDFVAKGKECWTYKEDSDFAQDIRQESANLVHDLSARKTLHNCADGVHNKAEEIKGRKIYKLDLQKLLAGKESVRIFMPKFHKNGTNMLDKDGKQIMDLLIIGKNDQGNPAVIGGNITPLADRSSAEDKLINDLQIIHAVKKSLTSVKGHEQNPKPISSTAEQVTKQAVVREYLAPKSPVVKDDDGPVQPAHLSPSLQSQAKAIGTSIQTPLPPETMTIARRTTLQRRKASIKSKT